MSSVCPPDNLTASVVRVSGPTGEPLHYHTSFVVGVVVHGRGVLHHRTSGGAQVDDIASEGDIVVIPRGAAHVFSTENGGSMDYIALEFSDQKIDYQAHLPTD